MKKIILKIALLLNQLMVLINSIQKLSLNLLNFLFFNIKLKKFKNS